MFLFFIDLIISVSPLINSSIFLENNSSETESQSLETLLKSTNNLSSLSNASLFFDNDVSYDFTNTTCGISQIISIGFFVL